MDKFDLRAAVESGNTPEEAAGFLCRSGTVEEVKRRADAMGLKWRDRDWPTNAAQAEAERRNWLAGISHSGSRS
jgi:hypothetical protein